MALKVKVYYMDDTASDEEFMWSDYNLESDLNSEFKPFIHFKWTFVNKKEIQFLTYEVQD